MEKIGRLLSSYHVTGNRDLRLNPDGTFTATGLPDCFLSLKPKGGFGEIFEVLSAIKDCAFL